MGNIEIEFEGKIVKPSSNGYYKCPFKCGNSGYPQPKWKTEKGFRQHMINCPKKPSYLLEKKRKEDERKIEYENRKEEALKNCKYKIGDKIFYWYEVITKPTHEQRGNRMVHVRYEAEKMFGATETEIKTINYDHAIYFNNGIRVNEICETLKDAEEMALKARKAYDEHCKFSQLCR